MPIKTRRYRPSDRLAIERLNQRLADSGVMDCVYPEDDDSQGFHGTHGPLTTNLWIAGSDDEIHGGVWLREQQFWIAIDSTRAGWVKYPVSESLVNKKLGGVPAALLFRLVREQPRLMIAGMGGHHQPIARLVASMGWTGITVASFLYVVRPVRFFLGFNRLRTTLTRRIAADCLGYSGLGALALKAYTLSRRTRRPVLSEPFHAELVDRFGPWADDLWERAKQEYTICAHRDATTLNHLYGSGANGLQRIVVYRDSTPIGFACTGLFASEHATSIYGNLSVGMIFDGFGQTSAAPVIMAAAVRTLIDQGADIIIANMAHPDWCTALQQLGCINAPSNYAFYWSPAIGKTVEAHKDDTRHMHITRADSHFPDGLQYLSAARSKDQD